MAFYSEYLDFNYRKYLYPEIISDPCSYGKYLQAKKRKKFKPRDKKRGVK